MPNVPLYTIPLNEKELHFVVFADAVICSILKPADSFYLCFYAPAVGRGHSCYFCMSWHKSPLKHYKLISHIPHKQFTDTNIPCICCHDLDPGTV